jgi:hypothetical protein
LANQKEKIMNTQDEDRDVFQSHCFDPFPQPQTIPSGWDLSGLFPSQQPDSDQPADDSAENDLVVE